jgi:hypothetical protein
MNQFSQNGVSGWREARQDASQQADIVTTKLASDILAGPFSDRSLAAEIEVVAARTSSSHSASMMDPSPPGELGIAEAFGGNIQPGSDATPAIQTIFPVLREAPETDESPAELKTVDGLAADADEPHGDSDAAARIARLRTALFGSAEAVTNPSCDGQSGV